MRRFLLATAALGAAVVLFLLLTLPSAPRALSSPDPGSRATIAGAFHVHSTRSDGASDKPTIAAAAARAGLGFVLFADHGDGTERPDPPAYLHGVLCLDGVEISTEDGHYVAVGMAASPYPLGGEARAVAEDVRRLGGFGIVAHPHSPKPSLEWSDWTVPVDGLEWLNADSEWRDEPRLRLSRTIFDYLIRPGPALAALLDRPAETLAQWDSIASTRRLLGLAGHDAHGGIGRRSAADGDGEGLRLPLPSYEASFRTFSNRLWLDRPLSGDAASDGAAVIAALKAGRLFTSIDALASPPVLSFSAQRGETSFRPGDVLDEGAVRFSATLADPADAVLAVLHDGVEIATGRGKVDADGRGPGAYRLEARLPGAPGEPPVPWLLTNPIFVLPLPSEVESPADLEETVLSLPAAAWRVEKDPESSGEISVVEGRAVLRYKLAAGVRRSQFVALAADLPRGVRAFDRVSFEARADAPMRVSVQLRFASGADVRWARSAFIDTQWQRVAVPVEELTPVGTASGAPDSREARSVLVVIDLTNARPGSAGTVELADAAVRRGLLQY